MELFMEQMAGSGAYKNLKLNNVSKKTTETFQLTSQLLHYGGDRLQIFFQAPNNGFQIIRAGKAFKLK